MATHRVKLSNGRVVLLKERDDALSIATEDDCGEAYICQISASGTLVYPNSDDAGEYLVRGLGRAADDAPDASNTKAANPTDMILTAAQQLVAELKAAGWTPEDFVNGLRGML